jgi:glycosyltransferase involved in cell wall biosynthesis
VKPSTRDAEGPASSVESGEPAGGGLRIAYLGDPGSVHVRRWLACFTGRHDVCLIVPEGVQIADGLPEGVTIERFEAMSGPLNPVRIAAARRSLRGAMSRLKPDVVHAHHATVNSWHAWLAGFHPYVVTVWGTDVLITARARRPGRVLTRLALRAADLVTGGSDLLVRAAVGAGARPDRARYVHFGVDTERFSPGDGSRMRSRLGLAAGARVLLSPRTIAPLYRHDVVLEAFSRQPADTVLVMTRHLAAAGEEAALMSQAAALGVADRVRVIDAVPPAEMPELYRLADAVVSVPASDGGPNTVVEALACGRPIVASDLPPNREWLADLDPAALVPVGDVAATAAAMRAVLGRSAAERDERAARGRVQVCARADRRATMALMDDLYRRLAETRRIAR